VECDCREKHGNYEFDELVRKKNDLKHCSSCWFKKYNNEDYCGEIGGLTRDEYKKLKEDDKLHLCRRRRTYLEELEYQIGKDRIPKSDMSNIGVWGCPAEYFHNVHRPCKNIFRGFYFETFVDNITMSKRDCAKCWNKPYALEGYCGEIRKREKVIVEKKYTLASKVKEHCRTFRVTAEADCGKRPGGCPRNYFKDVEDRCRREKDLNCATCWGAEYAGEKFWSAENILDFICDYNAEKSGSNKSSFYNCDVEEEKDTGIHSYMDFLERDYECRTRKVVRRTGIFLQDLI